MNGEIFRVNNNFYFDFAKRSEGQKKKKIEKFSLLLLLLEIDWSCLAGSSHFRGVASTTSMTIGELQSVDAGSLLFR